MRLLWTDRGGIFPKPPFIFVACAPVKEIILEKKSALSEIRPRVWGVLSVTLSIFVLSVTRYTHLTPGGRVTPPPHSSRPRGSFSTMKEGAPPPNQPSMEGSKYIPIYLYIAS